jgi:magnesium transporter
VIVSPNEFFFGHCLGFWSTVGPRSTARVVQRMHRVQLRTCSSHVMTIFGSSANVVYGPQRQVSRLASSVSRACHVVTAIPPAPSLTCTRKLYSNACNRSSKTSGRRSMQPIGLRHLSWLSRANSKLDSKGFSESQEEEAKAAILEKVMKGRQPTDLMLRCE